MTLTWKDPPERRVVFTANILAELRTNPGRWALIRTYPYLGRSASTVKHPTDIELRFNYKRSPNQTELYARAVPR